MGNKVLVVDDSITVLELVAEALEPEGFVTLQALDGRDALAKLAENEDIALVLSDVNMPRMGGMALLAAARDQGIAVPFVMLTTESHPDLVERARSLGVKGWLVKPVKAQILASTVKALLQPSASGRAASASGSGPAGRARGAHST